MTALLPSAIESKESFERAAKLFKENGLSVVEFYVPFEQAASRREIIESCGLSGIYLAALYQKRNGLNLASPDEAERQKALDATKLCIDAAKAAGAEAVLITSGGYCGDESASAGWAALEKSIKALLEYAGETRILLEPGDRSVDAKQLAGPTKQTVELAARICAEYGNFGLTMDTSHIAQLGESAEEALKLALPYCDHIHIANCVLKEGHPLYGDKHPVFAYHEAYYSLDELRQIAVAAAENYPKPLTMTVEIICREEDEWSFAEEVLEEERWFFEM